MINYLGLIIIILFLLCQNLASFSLYKNRIRVNTVCSNMHSNSEIPSSINNHNLKSSHSDVVYNLLPSLFLFLTVVNPALAVTNENFKDNENNFTIYIPEGWTILPRKIPSVSFSKYQSEEILLVASNFAEAVSFSISKTNARRLLKDFNIDWWFSELQSINDIGNADLISRLLISQRQNNFEGLPTATELINSEIKNNILYFEFLTPVTEGVKRKSIAKAYYLPDGYLYVLWISGLRQVFDSDYGEVLQEMLTSFQSIR